MALLPVERSRTGTIVDNGMSAFPMFFGMHRQPKVLTRDVWRFLESFLASSRNSRAKEGLPYLEQARDFYVSAERAERSAKPLLYYYSFMNLAKVRLATGAGLPTGSLQHGIDEHAQNVRRRLRFSGQGVRIHPVPASRGQNLLALFFRTFVTGMRLQSGPTEDYRVIDLLSQIPAIHRTFTQSVDWLDSDEGFCPVLRFEVIRRNPLLWAQMTIDVRDSKNYRLLERINSSNSFHQVWKRIEGLEDRKITYQTRRVFNYSGRRGSDAAIGRLAAYLRTNFPNVSVVLTPDGYRYYLSEFTHRFDLPQLVIPFSIMYYLGSMTRYRPKDFDKLDRKIKWLISEFLESQPQQFLYLLASWIAEREVVMPKYLGPGAGPQ
jgi:hypothetical protein